MLLTGLAGQSATTLQQYLFGSITTISTDDVWVTIALAVVVVGVCVGLAPQLFAVSQDQEFARVAGLNVRAYNIMVAVLAAVSVTVAMRTVGLLLVSALMVVPGGDRRSRSPARFRTTMFAAMALGIGASLGGLLLAAYAPAEASVAPGPTIVLLVAARLRGDLAARGLGSPAAPRLRAPFARRRARRAPDPRDPPPRARARLRPRRGGARRPRRLRPRRPPARRTRHRGGAAL